MGLAVGIRTVVVRFCATPWVTVPEVAPLASVTLMEAGGQVEKYPPKSRSPRSMP